MNTPAEMRIICATDTEVTGSVCDGTTHTFALRVTRVYTAGIARFQLKLQLEPRQENTQLSYFPRPRNKKQCQHLMIL